jgi:hypothetical protein
MEQYEYAITTHTADGILTTISDLSAEAEPPVVYCDAEGVCFFTTVAVQATMPPTLTRRPSSRYSTHRENKVGFWFRSRCVSRI